MAALEMPNPLSVNEVGFRLTRAQQVSPSGAGFIQTIERADPFWYVEYKSIPLDKDRTRVMRQFLDELEGSFGTFLAFDPNFRYPKDYPSGTGYGTPRVTAVNYANSTLSIDQFATTGWLRSGDYISFKDGNIWRLYRATEDKQAAAGVMTIKVKPRPMAIGGTRSLRLNRACAEVKMLGNPPESANVLEGTRVDFKAIQFINRA